MNNTSTWAETTPGYRTKTITRGNITVVIHRPILDEKERVKRERAVENALYQYSKATQS